jgi:RNA-binding protein
MPLSNVQLRYLRGLAHKLKPVVYLGQKGVTASVLSELEAALECHELVKVKLAGERQQKAELAGTLVQETRAEVVQQIGHVLCLYRRHPEKPRLALPE